MGKSTWDRKDGKLFVDDLEVAHDLKVGGAVPPPRGLAWSPAQYVSYFETPVAADPDGLAAALPIVHPGGWNDTNVVVPGQLPPLDVPRQVTVTPDQYAGCAFVLTCRDAWGEMTCASAYLGSGYTTSFAVSEILGFYVYLGPAQNFAVDIGWTNLLGLASGNQVGPQWDTPVINWYWTILPTGHWGLSYGPITATSFLFNPSPPPDGSRSYSVTFTMPWRYDHKAVP